MAWVELQVNGETVCADVPVDETLLQFVRGRAGLTGTKQSCGRGECGACTMLVGDRPVMSCVLLAGQTRGQVTTIEGLSAQACGLRRSFAEQYGFQCGYCTPGQIVRAHALLAEAAQLDRETVAAGMSGNICRCTGYAQIVDAVLAEARRRGVPVRGEEDTK